MKNLYIHFLLQFALTFYSCQHEEKKQAEEKGDTSQISILKTVEDSIKHPEYTMFQKEEKKIYLNDTLIIHERTDPGSKFGLIQAEGRIGEIKIVMAGRTEKDTTLTYLFGIKKMKFNKDTIPALTILLKKDSSIVSELVLDEQFEFMVLVEFKMLDLPLDGIDESMEMGFGRGQCGYGYHNVLFFRRGNELIKGLQLFTEGEGGYFDENEVVTKGTPRNEVWIQRKVGTSLDNNKEEIYFTEYQKFSFRNYSLILLNPKKPDYYYVSAKNGLHPRSLPYPDGDTVSILKYGTKVNVLNKTNMVYSTRDNGKTIKGNWVQIENIIQGYNYPAYVFDGYLSKTLP